MHVRARAKPEVKGIVCGHTCAGVNYPLSTVASSVFQREVLRTSRTPPRASWLNWVIRALVREVTSNLMATLSELQTSSVEGPLWPPTNQACKVEWQTEASP